MVLPSVGQYLLVIDAGGWAPVGEVFVFNVRNLQQNQIRRDRLRARGTVSTGDTPVACAVVARLETGGGHVGTTRTDDGGSYVLTMLHPLPQEVMAKRSQWTSNPSFWTSPAHMWRTAMKKEWKYEQPPGTTESSQHRG